MDMMRSGEAAIASRLRLPKAVRILGTVVIGVAASAALLWVAPPDTVIHQITRMRIGWVLASIGLEVGSCLSYPIIFRRCFPEPPRGEARRVAWISMGAGAVLPGGNISSAAATGWLLRRHGVGARQLIARCAALLCLLTLFGFFVNGLAGTLLLLGVPGGPHDLLHTGGPILVSIAVIGAAFLLMLAPRWLGPRTPAPLRGIADPLDRAWTMTCSGNWRLIGAAGFLLLDMAALWAACEATGHPIGPFGLAIGYCIGYLATILPVPAGLGVLDSGLSATLVLYGMHPAASVGAVLVYHAISIWVPGTGGLIAWLPTRRGRAGRSPVPGPLAAAEHAAARLAEFPVLPLTPVADHEG